MKIRVRKAGLVPPSTVKVEVEAGETFSVLRQRAAAALGLPEADTRLSLNKKVALEADEASTVSSVGLCAGDLLWVLAPDAADTSAGALPAVQASEMTSALPSAHQIQDRPSSTTASAHCLGATVTQDSLSDAEMQAPVDPIGQMAMSIDAPQGTECSQMGTGMEDDAEMPESAAAEDAGNDAASAAPALPGHLHRVLQRGLEGLQANLPCQLKMVILAVHAAFLETGLVLDRDQNLNKGSSSTVRMHYCFPEQRPTDRGAQMWCSVLGRHMVVYGTLADSSNAPGPSPLISITIDSKCHVSEDGQAFTDLKGLWFKVKDSLCRPLLTAMCVASGRPPPVGLATLPGELKEACLEHLSATALVSLICTCAEFRHLGASNALWKPLFLAEFPNQQPVPGVHGTANVNWYAAYRARYIQRQDAQERAAQRSRAFAQARAPRHGFIAPPPAFMGPGIITGGDFDRLPAPLLGQTGPQFPGVGLLGGPGYRTWGGGAGNAGSMGGGVGLPGMPGSGRRGSRTQTLPHF